MIDHVGIPVRNLVKSKTFYTRALKPLGYTPVFGKKGDHWGFSGKNGLLVIYQSERKVVDITHVAFRATSKKHIRDFYNAALRAGGKNNGAPGACPEYSPSYYAAFVFDLDGHNIEAMIR